MSDFDLGGLASNLIRSGGKVLGTVLGTAVAGPVGAAVGGPLVGQVIDMAADALGVARTPEAVNNAIASRDPADVAAQLAAKEAEAAAKWPALAQIAVSHDEVAKAQIAATADRMRDELEAMKEMPYGMKAIALFLATIWRPLYAIEGLVECAFFAGLLYRIIARAFFIDGEEANLTLLMGMTPFLTAIVLPYMTARFALLGYYMKKRTDEKIAETESGANAPIVGTAGLDVGSLVNGLLGVLMKRG